MDSDAVVCALVEREAGNEDIPDPDLDPCDPDPDPPYPDPPDPDPPDPDPPDPDPPDPDPPDPDPPDPDPPDPDPPDPEFGVMLSQQLHSLRILVVFRCLGLRLMCWIGGVFHVMSLRDPPWYRMNRRTCQGMLAWTPPGRIRWPSETCQNWWTYVLCMLC